MGPLFILLAAVFPFAMMPLMWRRMKKVQRQVREQREERPAEQPWEEAIEREDGLTLARTSSPNDELIALGAKARQTRWPLDNG